MTKEFFAEYMKKDNRRRREMLYVMNPIKFMTCQFLIEYHEQHRRDKVIVFSDNIFAMIFMIYLAILYKLIIICKIHIP